MASTDQYNKFQFKTEILIDYPNIIKRSPINRMGQLISEFIGTDEDVAIITDNAVADIYGNEVANSITSIIKSETLLFSIASGEQAKSQQSIDELTDQMLKRGVHRNTVIVALGGGVVCDTVGFLSAIYMRGLSYINIPTSMIGQVDASIGGKVAVNHSTCKNLIGRFYHPRAVIINPNFLASLPADEIRNGLAEAVKVAIIASPELFSLLESHAIDLVDNTSIHSQEIDTIIAEAVQCKINMLLPDPFENDLKRVLNFGHTFAHPLEVAEGFNLRHGYAVAIGMCISTVISLQRNMISLNEAERILNLLWSLELPVKCPVASYESIWEHAKVIKYIRANHFHYVVPVSIGQATFIDDLTRDEFIEAATTLEKLVYPLQSAQSLEYATWT